VALEDTVEDLRTIHVCNLKPVSLPLMS